LVSTSESRFDAWHATLTIIGRNPVAGIGFYEFQELSQGIEGVSETTVHPHNGFLKALVEQGPLAGLAYLLFLAGFLTTAIMALRLPQSSEDKWIFASIGGIGACLFTQELFDAGFTIGGSSVAILFATLLGLQVQMLRNATIGRSQLVSRVPR
jgi:O-antigen ligase